MTLDITLAAVAQHSWKLVLLNPRAKTPLSGQRWQITDDPGVIRAHNGNLGLVAGQSGVAVLDFDNIAAMEEMFKELGPLQLWVKTGSGKFHAYTKLEDELPAKIRWSGVIVGDVQRGPTQQVVCPPSIHPSGEKYEWLIDPVLTEIPTLPDAWRQYLMESQPVGLVASTMPSPTVDSDKIVGIEPGVGLPMIVIRAGDLPQIVDQAEAALANSVLPIYQRGMVLVRPVRVDKDVNPNEAVRRPPGALIITDIRGAWLKESMCRTANWVSWSDKDKALTRKDPNMDHVNTLLDRKEWRFPILKSVSPAPTLDLDGRIIEREGYDQGTQLLMDFGGSKFPPVPVSPTKAQAREALTRLIRPFRMMPFVTQADRAVALSALLTVMVRQSLNAAPLHMFDSPTPGSGKSKIADCVGIMKTNGKPPSVSQGKDDEEDEKRLSSVLAKADPVILLDNCSKPLTGDFLCSVLTQSVVQARILGQSEMRTLPSMSLIIATGNNMSTGGDTFRRVVLCTLDPRCERPEERHFDFDPVQEFREQRAQLAIDALCALRAYRVAGSPLRNTLTPMGSFEDWAWVRETLVWLGERDPADTRITIIANDAAAQELEHIMSTWEKEYGNRRLPVAEIRAEGPTGRLLHEATGRHDWSPKSVGRWLARNKDRVKSNLVFRAHPGRGGIVTWELEGAQARVNMRPEVRIAVSEERTDAGF